MPLFMTRLFRWRPFRAADRPFRFPKELHLAAFLAGVVDALLVFYLPLHLHRNLQERHLIMVGLVVALPQLSVFVASNLWGALADQWRRLKPLVLIGTGGFAVMLAALSLAHTTAAVLWFAMLGAVVYSAYKPAALTYVTLLEPQRKGHAVAALMRTQSLGWLIGNLGCLALLERYGWRAMNWTLALAGGVAAVIFVVTALRMREIDPAEFEAHRRLSDGTLQPAEPPRGFWGDLAALYENPALVWVSVVWFFTTGGRWLFYTFFTILFTDLMHGSVRVVGVASGCSALAGLFFFGVAGRWVDRLGSRVVFLGSVLGYAVYFAANMFLTQPYVVAALFIIPIYPAFVVAGNAMVASIVRRDQRAGGLGVITGTEALGAVAGALLGGWAGDRFGVGVTPLMATLLTGTALVLAAGVLRRPVQAQEE
jgi:predicted MFS family arabinose efflux permease